MADVEAILNRSPVSHDKHNDHNNDHSVRGTTTSSRDTAPSTGQRSQALTHSETCTTPSHSRMQSPVRHRPRTDMEEDLAGIGTRGCQTDQYVDGRSCATLPSRPLQHQPATTHPPLDVDSATRHVDEWSLDEESCLSDDREHIIRRGSGTLTPHGSSPISCSDGLMSLGEMFQDTIYTITEGSDSQSDSVDESDIHLERHAGDLLSEWFGININSLERPIRVIHCLEQIKGQMAAVLEEEGHSLPEDGSEDPDMDEMVDDDFPEIQPRDGENAGHATSHGRSQAGEGSSRSGTDKKRLSNGDLKSSMSSKLKTTARDPRKKHCIGLDLACPFRKRNPCHFNVRQYERCALRSHVNMASLKKHLLADHYKPTQPSRTCNRCQQSFQDQNDTMQHLQQCPASPRSESMANIIGPEGGFGDNIRRRLASRKDQDKIHDWDSLYMLLFPGTMDVPDANFDPIIEIHDILAKLAGDSTMSAEERQRLKLWFQRTYSNLFGRQEQTIAGSQIPTNTEVQGDSSTFPPEEDFVDLGMDSSQHSYTLDDIFAADEVSMHFTSNTGPVEFLNLSRVPQSDPSQNLRSIPLLPALGYMDNQPRSAQSPNQSYLMQTISQPDQAVNYILGVDAGLQVPPVLGDRFIAGNRSFDTPSTYTPTTNTPGLRNSATWPSNNANFTTDQDISWNGGTMSFEDAEWTG